MVENQQTIPECITNALMEMGYEPDDTMRAQVEEWWEWYTARADWYDKTETVDGKPFNVRRNTLHPARRVCREWASAILDDDGTKIAADDEHVDELLGEWAKSTRFIPIAQRALERAFATGTAALALWFDVQMAASEDGRQAMVTQMRARRYDARCVLPLSWDDDGVAECAFVTRTYVDGKAAHQLQVHRVENGTYHVVTRMFDEKTSAEVHPDWSIPDFATGIALPTFAILRPAIDNVFAEGTYMGQSVFADAVDAIKGVDNAFDSMQREIDATKVKVFMDESLFDLQRDEDGRMRAMPMSPENTVIMKVSGDPGKSVYEVFSPTIRTAQLAEALNVALSELGDLTGFGQDYFRYDRSGGLRTATEVSADNSAFMRNIRKHENELRPQLERLLAATVECHRALGEWADVPADVSVTVDFDDSIIQDTASEKAQMLAEVSAGIVPRWMYLQRFYAMGEDEARELTGDPEAIDVGA